MKTFNVFGTGLHAESFSIAAENRVNCYYEVRKEEAGARIIVRGTPGSSVKFSLPLSPIRGWRVVGEYLYVVASNSLYRVSSTGTVTLLGTLLTSAGRVAISDNFIQICMVDGVYGYVYTIATSSLSQITDANFPNGATTITFLSSRFIVEKQGTREFYVSDTLDGLVWTKFFLPIYATKEQYSDLLSAVDSFNGILVLWGTGSVEYWQDAGLSPQPFQLISGSTQGYGLAAKHSRVQINHSIFFLGTGSQGGFTVYALSQYEPKRVSTDDVEALISKWASQDTVADAVGLSYSIDGHDMYQLTFPNANQTLVYDTTTGLWGVAQTGVVPGRHFADTSIKFSSLTLFSDSDTNNIYVFSKYSYTDNLSPILRQVTSKHIRSSGDEFSITELALVMDTGEVPQGQEPKISLEVSRDGGRTFGSPRPRTVGAVGQYRTPRVKWDRMGSARDFVLRFSMVEGIPFNISGVEIQTSVSK